VPVRRRLAAARRTRLRPALRAGLPTWRVLGR
jgi:hypothetical protein